ncbi:MAG: phospholipid carrier-dependent glycosyltransferase [Dehalococcoidia bacterium]|nr:phospholipid carrier-dependent glycosyltransferase [Dehalococcoidia bacterium]
MAPAMPTRSPSSLTSALGASAARRFLSQRWELLVLAAILGISLFFRIYGIAWDGGTLFHPDERAIIVKVHELNFPTHDLSSLFTKESPLNPHWFPYGSFPLYVLKFVAWLAPPFLHQPDLARLAEVGRALSAVFDTFTILLVYLTGARLFGKVTGLLGAALIGLAALHIQQSHFMVTDVMLAAFLMASFFFLTRVMEGGRRRHFLLAAIFFGLALATKISAAPFALAFVVAGLLYARQRGLTPEDRRLRGGQAWRGLLTAALVAGLVFVAAQPYAIIDWARFTGDVTEQSEMVRRIRDYPYTRQYIDTTPYLYQARQLATWGVGLPAGLLLWGGFLASLIVAARRRDPRHILLLSWAVPYFLITGGFDVKFMRYMIPLTPFLAIIAGALMTAAVRWARERRRPLLQWALVTACGSALALTLLYAVSYVRIYARPHPAQAAAAWLRENTPPNAVFAKEHWEEGLPNLPGHPIIELELYNDDHEGKRRQVMDRLVQADYLVFYSNRLYATIPRLPEPYPFTSAYYEMLFSGNLGFELAHWESSYPNLFGVSLKNDTFARQDLPEPRALQDYRQTSRQLNLGFADESFTVYDHPLVLIFKKTVAGPPQEQLAFFDRTLPKISAAPASATEGIGLLLSPDEAQRQQAGGTWSRLFSRGLGSGWATALWYAVVQLMFLVALPLTWVVFRRLPDRGYLLGKMLGVLLATYIPWILASTHILPFTRLSIGVGLLAIAAASALALWRTRAALLPWLRANLRLVLACELLFLTAFLAFTAIRAWNPDLWHPYRGGEKPMDFAYFNAVARSSWMPPYDPWFSGGYLNYYYFGQFMNAAIAKFTGIMPAVAVNLAVPLFFALTVAGAFSIAYNLAALARQRLPQARLPSALWAGLAAAVFVAIAGNLDGLAQLFQGTQRWLTGDPFGQFDFWRSSRMMPDSLQGITEFPFFTFLFADPHAHLFVIPLTLLALGLSLALLLEGKALLRHVPLTIAALALTLGAILATNRWDVLAYALIACVSILAAEYHARGPSWEMLRAAVIKVAGLALLSLLLFFPYLYHYQPPPPGGGDPWLLSRLPLPAGLGELFTRTPYSSPLWRYLLIHGLFIAILLSFLVWEFLLPYRSALRRGFVTLTLAWPRTLPGIRTIVGIALTVLAFVSFLAGYITIAFLLLLLLLIGALAWRQLARRDAGMPPKIFLYIVVAAALLIGIFVDRYQLNSPTEVERMNTVFKFYLQAWVMLAVASAYTLWRFGLGGEIAVRPFRWLWRAGISVLLIGVLIYPIMAVPVRARDRFNPMPPTLNGEAFQQEALFRDFNNKGAIEFSHDLAAIHWLEDNVQGSPVIIEGITPLYRWGNRVSVYTGLPAVIGWDWHQTQQRFKWRTAVDQRRRDVELFYTTSIAANAAAVLDRYRVSYVYVGELERLYYPASGIAKFETLLGGRLAPVYRTEKVQIYRVLPTR